MSKPSSPKDSDLGTDRLFKPDMDADQVLGMLFASEVQNRLEDMHSNANSPSLSSYSEDSQENSPAADDPASTQNTGAEGSGSESQPKPSPSQGPKEPTEYDKSDKVGTEHAEKTKNIKLHLDKLHSRCSTYDTGPVSLLSRTSTTVTYLARPGMNFLPALELPSCIVMCSALGGKCQVALSQSVPNCLITLVDRTSNDGVFCGIQVMLNSDATNSKNQLLCLEGRFNRSVISPPVMVPGATLYINRRAGTIVLQRIGDTYHLISHQDVGYEDTKLELELSRSGFKHHTFMNTNAMVV